MAKLPFFQFYPLDWLRDTGQLSPKAKAAWIDLLSYAWNEPERGVFSRSKEAFCNLLRIDPADLLPVLTELGYVSHVTLSDKIVTVKSKRMMRFDLARNGNAIRQDRFRRNARSNAKVTVQTLDVRRQTLDVIKNKDKETTKNKRIPFSIPTQEKIKEFIANNRLTVDAENFWNHYQSNGWRVGRNPMKDWQAALRTWQRNGINNGGLHGAPRSKSISEQVNERRRTQGLERLGENLTAREILDRIGNLPSV